MEVLMVWFFIGISLILIPVWNNKGMNLFLEIMKRWILKSFLPDLFILDVIVTGNNS